MFTKCDCEAEFGTAVKLITQWSKTKIVARLTH